MRYRPLGITGLSVSELGFGCASWWGKAAFDEETALALVNEAMDLGVTLFDTGDDKACARRSQDLSGASSLARNSPIDSACESVGGKEGNARAQLDSGIAVAKEAPRINARRYHRHNRRWAGCACVGWEVAPNTNPLRGAEVENPNDKASKLLVADSNEARAHRAAELAERLVPTPYFVEKVFGGEYFNGSALGRKGPCG